MSITKDLLNGKLDGLKFPPTEDAQRLADYKKNELLFDGKHQIVFEPNFEHEKKTGRGKIDNYIVCNYAGIISKICSDLLFGEPIEIEGESDAVNEKIEAIMKRSRMEASNAESALMQSYAGDLVIKARYEDGKGAIIEYCTPSIYFPEINPDNINDVLGITLGWVRRFNDVDYLRAEIHEKGIIHNRLYKLNDKKEIEYEVPLELLYDNLAYQVETGVDDFLVKNIPNFKKVDSHYGLSDYHDLESLFKAINNRVSRVSTVHDRHSDPILVVPRGVLDENGEVKRGNLQMFEITSDTAEKPQYIVWDAKIESAFKEIEMIEQMILQNAEISTGALGVDKGGVAESGRALKFKLLRTLAKIKRKQRYYNDALESIMKSALALEKVKADKLDIKWGDGVPVDEREQAEINEIKLRSEQISIEEVLRQENPEWTDKQIAEELEKIQGNSKVPEISGGFGSDVVKNAQDKMMKQNGDDSSDDNMQMNGQDKTKK